MATAMGAGALAAALILAPAAGAQENPVAGSAAGSSTGSANIARDIDYNLRSALGLPVAPRFAHLGPAAEVRFHNLVVVANKAKGSWYTDRASNTSMFWVDQAIAGNVAELNGRGYAALREDPHGSVMVYKIPLNDYLRFMGYIEPTLSADPLPCEYGLATKVAGDYLFAAEMHWYK